MYTKYEEIIELVKKLDVIAISDVKKIFKVGCKTANRILLRMENNGILKHRKINKYKVWTLRKYK